MQIYFKNEPELETKLEDMRKAGPDKLQVVIDFDQTMTKSHLDGRKLPNSFSAVSKLLPTEFVEGTARLFDFYHPIENDPGLGLEEKLPLMQKWWDGVIELMLRHGLSRQLFQQVVDSEMMPLRDGVVDFFRLAAGARIQTIVFSAGMGDLIEMALVKNGIRSEQVHLTANFLDFNDDGLAVGIRQPMITSMNKTEEMLKGKSFYEELRRRRNVLLVGDGLHDVDMVDEKLFDRVLKVGLLNQNVDNQVGKLALEHFLKIYEVVLVGDGSFEKVTELLKRML